MTPRTELANTAQDNAQDGAQDALLLDAVITPNRSLSPRGFLFVMGALGGLSFAAGVTFISLGAWPVIGFFGLDVLLVYLAFRLNYAEGARTEFVRVRRGEVHIRQTDRRGRTEAEARLNPAWARLVVTRDEEDRVANVGLRLHDRLYPLAEALSPPERGAFAGRLDEALTAARG